MPGTDPLRPFLERVSVREYTNEPVDESLLKGIIDAARRAPTSSNLQAYSLILVRDPATRKQLAGLAGNQRHVAQAPVFIAFCADQWRIAQACEMHGTSFSADTLEMGMVSVVDAALAGMAASLAAETLGLGSVMIGGMRNHPEEVAALLGLPPKVFVVFGLCIGWPAHRPPQKPRLPEQTLVHRERYQTQGIVESLKAHDAMLATHYRNADRETMDAAWSGHAARQGANPSRAYLREVLQRLGLMFG